MTTRTAKNAAKATIEGHVIQHDNSGVGHNWLAIDADDLPPAIRQEIEEEIIDGKRESGQIIGTNGLHYRWS